MEAVALSLKTTMQESPNLTIINWNIKCEDKQLKKSIRLENYQYVWEKTLWLLDMQHDWNEIDCMAPTFLKECVAKLP